VEFGEVLRRRRMVRTFLDRPIDSEVVERLLAAGHRAPSAGFTQGYSFLVFDGREETARFWQEAFPDRSASWFSSGIRLAPLIVVPLASKDAYLDRYAQPDKGWTDRDESRWPAPYWLVDASFAAMLILMAAVDEGLGAVFFGIFPPENQPRMLAAFGVPEEWEAIGAIAIGHPDPREETGGSALRRRRKPLADIVHRGGW
jgi:nitroreductase